MRTSYASRLGGYWDSLTSDPLATSSSDSLVGTSGSLGGLPGGVGGSGDGKLVVPTEKGPDERRRRHLAA